MRFLPALAAAVALLGPATGARASRTSESRRSHAPAQKPLPAIELQHLSTHETLLLRPEKGGHVGRKQLRALRHFLRCHHTGREHAMSPRLADLLWATAHHFDDRPVTVIAGYRAPKVARKKGNPRSPHKRGVACDFRIQGIDNTVLRDYLRGAFSGIGVGYYPNSGFIHLDVGRGHSAFWIDYSGPGERADYSSDPEEDLRTGRADANRRPDAEPVEREDDEEPFADDPGLAGLLAPPPPVH